MVRYLVRCAHCDRAFWQDSRDVPVPEHTRWERRVSAQRLPVLRCDGSKRQGYWIAEGEGLLADWPPRSGHRRDEA
jgi:hypothetical protein